MSLYAPEQNNTKTFAPHPAGKFSAVLYDMYALEEVNYFHGKADGQGQIDNRITSVKLYLCFLTSAKTEDGKPCFIRHGLSFSLGKNAKLTATLKAWIPALREVDNLAGHFDRKHGVSLETLLGMPAFLEIGHNTKNPERIYDRVDSISELPNFDPKSGSPLKVVEIPEDQKRANVAKLQIKAYQRVIEKFPQSAPAMNAKIKALEGTGDFMEGLEERPQATPGQRPANTAGDMDDLPF